MDSFPMNRGRPREPAWLTCGEELVLFSLWLWLRVEMVLAFESCWWWTLRGNEDLLRHPCLGRGVGCRIVRHCSNDNA